APGGASGLQIREGPRAGPWWVRLPFSSAKFPTTSQECAMTAPTLTVFLERLERAAHEASIAEENYRREASERFRVLERERAFGFRRFNLMGAVLAALGGSKDEDEALASGSAAFLREMSWSGTTDSQKETLEHFQPVIRAGWALMQVEPGAPE